MLRRRRRPRRGSRRTRPRTRAPWRCSAAAAAGLDAVAGVDPELDALAERLRTIVLESGDLAAELRDYGERLAGEDGSLEEVEQRLAATERLVRKHGGSIADVLAYAERARARREELDGAEVALAHTRRASDERARRSSTGTSQAVAPRAQAGGAAPGERRRRAARRARDGGCRLRGRALRLRSPGPSGGDSVEMTIAPNPGVPAGPLREIASGGELSRVMLAVITSTGGRPDARGREARPRRRTGRHERRATLVFDEIDAGIGGHTARAVGERLRALAASRQVLCITHLPQIASLGARHFSVVKDTSADPTLATVVQLGEPEVVSELVRMLGAQDGDDRRSSPRQGSAQGRLRSYSRLRWPPQSSRRAALRSRGHFAPAPEPFADIAPWRTVTGPARLGRRTKLLVRHLSRGDIAVIDHLDIDRVSAEELIAAGTAAVLNCKSLLQRHLPEPRPPAAGRSGRHLLDLPDDSLFRAALRR